MFAEKFESVSALKRELNNRRWDASGVEAKRIAYLVLLDSETGINKGRLDHRWVFIESEDWYSNAFTRSTTDSPRGLKAPQRIHSGRHAGHQCKVLTKDAAIYFIDNFLLTPAPALGSKIAKTNNKLSSWESRLKSISSNGVICIEPSETEAEMITICRYAREY